MARTVGLETLDQKIEKAQSDVVKTKKRYDLAVSTLKDLMDKRDALKRDELINAIMKSEKSYEQILQFIQESDQEKV
ncbi:hypothetical protein [Fusibacter tunisiensis]|jgi:energy-converting hydrogenase A subunit M|uniref:Energy-converting hydrogenase A subunit M n=1 Tax=Fusibacter tunisiensis TaxID=1008308 RepID=A0ABS2MUK1_9FIRM|nr:hypothetical protein [Fusibacter tunisiensis]MBM7563055.1 energy-converting hydrogenase A subunit M [Fusibacter tunisiensis]